MLPVKDVVPLIITLVDPPILPFRLICTPDILPEIELAMFPEFTLVRSFPLISCVAYPKDFFLFLYLKL
nr:hypothetical protein BACY1_16620 [Tenacibaculum mesophilum]